MSTRSTSVRVLTLALAFVHSFPARGHVAAFLQHPTIADGWKGFAALFAVAFYVMPVRWQARALGALWRRRRALAAATWSLALVHMVPLLEHLPRFLGSGDWADGWRGLGACVAVLWFVAPVSQQAAFLAAVVRLGVRIRATGNLSQASGRS